MDIAKKPESNVTLKQQIVKLEQQNMKLQNKTLAQENKILKLEQKNLHLKAEVENEKLHKDEKLMAIAIQVLSQKKKGTLEPWQKDESLKKEHDAPPNKSFNLS